MWITPILTLMLLPKKAYSSTIDSIGNSVGDCFTTLLCELTGGTNSTHDSLLDLDCKGHASETAVSKCLSMHLDLLGLDVERSELQEDVLGVDEGRRFLKNDRPLFQPYSKEKAKHCNEVCEPKRSQCGYFYIGTYVVCGFFDYYVDLILGTRYGFLCTLATIPPTVDCSIHSYFNCYSQGCGLFGYKFKRKFRCGH